MNADIYKRFSLKLELGMRYAMVRLLSGGMPLYIVNEYPKSGGTWVGQMLGRALEVPFPRNRFPVLRSSIMHGHYLNPMGMRNVVVVWRDGRDVIVSWYHHCLFFNEHGNAPLVKRVRRELQFSDYEDVSANLPGFIDYCFTKQASPRFSWADFAARWHGRPGTVHVHYEKLREDTMGELARLVRELSGASLSPERAAEIADEFSFSRMSGRKPGQENKKSFMRKGVVGDWRNHFTAEARELFDRYAGRELILLGYERDHDWVKGG